MFKVISLPRLRGLFSALEQATLEADSRACCTAQPVKRGVPRTDLEWTALLKIASGETDIAPAQCERLVALGLVERRGGVPALTRHGRFTLGLPE
jgi:hypothetical protein